MRHVLTFDGQEIAFDAQEKDAEIIKRIITDLMTCTGFVNLDLDDVKEIVDGAENVVAGEGTASGENRCADAAREAVKNIYGVNRLLVEVKSGPEVTLMELADAAEMVHETVDPTATLIWGHVIDEAVGDAVSVSVIAGSFAVDD